MEALVSQIFSVGFGIIVPFIFVLTLSFSFTNSAIFMSPVGAVLRLRCFPSVSVAKLSDGPTNWEPGGVSA